MCKTEGAFNSSTDKKNQVSKVTRVIFLLLNGFRKVFAVFRCQLIFGDFYVILMQTITLLRDVCFVRIIIEWRCNIILSAYVT